MFLHLFNAQTNSIATVVQNPSKTLSKAFTHVVLNLIGYLLRKHIEKEQENRKEAELFQHTWTMCEHVMTHVRRYDRNV